MRGDALVNNQRLIAQAIFAVANHLNDATGIALTPITFAQLPANPQLGWVACITDGQVSGATQWGNVVTGGGTENLLIWYNGTSWTAVGK